jgi:bifunctional non-homologous end joining protein LigD
VPPYAVRAHPGAPVATPIEWAELGRVESRSYAIGNIGRRLGGKDDPWRGLWSRARSIGGPREKLDRLIREPS